MIATFRHKGLQKFFADGDRRGIPAQLAPRIARMMDRLEICKGPGDMNLPGYRFHELKGNRSGTYSIAASANWRITFKFEGQHAIEVNLEDYH